MKKYNVIAVFNEAADRILMCRRRKDPYKGLSNFVGGKVEKGESCLNAAYRELWEETSITREDISLTHFSDFTYYLFGYCLEVYVGKLNKEVKVFGEENELYWSSLEEDFFDMNRYAGEGSVGHILEEMKLVREELFRGNVPGETQKSDGEKDGVNDESENL